MVQVANLNQPGTKHGGLKIKSLNIENSLKIENLPLCPNFISQPQFIM